jgi:uncharacterized membrane protein (UPF0127 family)
MALPLELPVSTVLMLRRILDVARGQGEDLTTPETALSALEVFALGGEGPENGYFAVRGMLAKSLTEAARFIAERGIVAEGAPVLVRFLAQIGSRFGIIVSQKFAAQALPMIGAVSGAAVNYAFMHHFQDVADAHFLVRRLERIYGQEAVRVRARLTDWDLTRDGTPHEFNVEMALTPDQQTVGLMFRPTVPAGGGMLFDWGVPHDSQMWMRNTIASLDMVFINADGTIRSIAENTVPESLAVIDSRGPVRATLELAAGTTARLNIRVGDRVQQRIFGNAP